jgi:hypothetical protein
MSKKTIFLLAIGLLLFVTTSSQEYSKESIDSLVNSAVQAEASRSNKFLISGYTNVTVQFTKEKTEFNNLGFTPILLWRPHENIIVEAEVETGLEGNETSIELGYADASFFLSRYLTIRAGKFLSPFGIFQDRLHPSWINKLPTFPVGTGEDELGVGPTSEVGIDFRGGIPLGNAKLNYSVFAGNGAQLITDPSQPEKQGSLKYGFAEGINKNLTGGGRVGFLPFSNSSLELGFSYHAGKVGEENSAYQDIGAQMYAYDITYVQDIELLKGTFDLKAQYNRVKVDQADYIDPADSTGATTYTFNNDRNSFFGQAAYRLTMARSKLLKKTELVFRYAQFNPPEGAKGLEKIKEYTYGIDYWFNWRTVLKAAYEKQESENIYFIQMAVGF